MQLVDIRPLLPGALFDIRYATDRNPCGEKLYEDDQHVMLDEPTAHALARFNKAIASQGMKLVVWDAYRTPEAQQRLLAVNNDHQYVREESNHCKGLAVDVTLARLNGQLLDMGTDHDEFTPRAHADSAEITDEQRQNRLVLRSIMELMGFTQWPYEWWHFDFTD